MRNILTAVAVLIFSLSGIKAAAITTLFEYPTAPDTCTTIESRCNYSIQHFWDNCELTRPFEARNDSLLLEAMMTYFDIMKAGADINISLASARNLMFKAQANHDNFLKLASAAEYLLYYHDTDIIDDLYLAFAQSVADASWAKSDVRNHYKDQIKHISTSKLGQPLLNFEYTSITGARRHLTDNPAGDARIIVLLFSEGNGTGSSIERMRLSTDVTVNSLIEQGVMKVINIVCGDTPKQWDSDSQSYSAAWEVGAAKDVVDKLDIRMMPCVYILDENYNVLAKNKTVDYVKNLFK